MFVHAHDCDQNHKKILTDLIAAFTSALLLAPFADLLIGGFSRHSLINPSVLFESFDFLLFLTLHLTKTRTFKPEDPNYIFKNLVYVFCIAMAENRFSRFNWYVSDSIAAWSRVGRSLDFIKRTRSVLESIFRETSLNLCFCPS